MVDEGRRRALRLALFAAGTAAGGAYLLRDRLLNDAASRVATGPNTSAATERAPVTSTSTTPPTSSPGTTPEARPVAGGSITMLCRRAWRAAAPTHTLAPHQIAGLMVHHTAVLLDDNRESPERLRGHQRFHQSRGFADIAYHVFVDAHGNVYEGRDQTQPGETFTDYDPTGWFLVVCEGNFDEQPLPDAQRAGLARVLAWAARRYGVAPEDIASHRDHADTRCPGDAIHGLVLDGTLSGLVRNAGTVELEELCGAEAEARISSIEAGTL